MVDKIDTRQVMLPTDHSALEQVQSEKQEKLEPFINDTIEQVTVVPPKKALTIFTSPIAWIQGFFNPIAEQEERTEKIQAREFKTDWSRPQIEPPVQLEKAHTEKMVNEMQLLQSKVKAEKAKKTEQVIDEAFDFADKKLEEVQRMTESELERLTLIANREQGKLSELDGEDASRRIIERQKKLELIRDKIQILRDKIQQQRKISKVLGWIGVGAGLIGAIIGVAAAAVAIIGTGGAALPVVLGAAGGIAAISGGGTQISKSVLDYIGGKNEGNAFALKEEQSEEHFRIKQELDNLTEADGFITETWKNMGEIQRNFHDAILALR
ncbi:MAG: hypothetical protein H7A37_05140 [Chlamydiales bacterium]|nr:hypothetical protein [Chlamydiia bacterium]MCP5507664.1 hypothetical protein [Chlamydiales bacterium]